MPLVLYVAIALGATRNLAKVLPLWRRKARIEKQIREWDSITKEANREVTSWQAE